MLVQMQATTTIPSLVTLESHPDFQQGMADAREQFLESYEPAPLTEDQMVEAVEAGLSRSVVEMNKTCGGSYSYFYDLGYAFGTINEGLAHVSPTSL